MSRTSATARGSPSSGPPRPPRRSPAPTPGPRPRSTTPTASTRRRASPARTSRASGPAGRAPSRAVRTWKRPRTAGAAETVVAERSAVITGASRGLGLASAAHLHRQGWRVVAAVRSPDAARERLRAATGAAADDPRLVTVRLDLDDPASITAGARAIREAVGAPDAVVHNAGVAAVGCVEEMPAAVSAQIFSTNVFGPMRLTQELLPAMRAAGRGRIVVVSSQGGVRGMPAISAYSAAKGALERWAEALSHEVAAFGIGVTVLVTGT